MSPTWSGQQRAKRKARHCHGHLSGRGLSPHCQGPVRSCSCAVTPRQKVFETLVWSRTFGSSQGSRSASCVLEHTTYFCATQAAPYSLVYGMPTIPPPVPALHDRQCRFQHRLVQRLEYLFQGGEKAPPRRQEVRLFPEAVPEGDPAVRIGGAELHLLMFVGRNVV